MPDILIRGMEMPHNCFQCQLSVLKGERLFCEVTKEEVLRKKLAPECPLHELPPHGDLISRDEAVSVLQNIGSRDYRREKGTICDAIKMISHSQYVPTIVPASEEVTNDPKP